MNENEAQGIIEALATACGTRVEADRFQIYQRRLTERRFAPMMEAAFRWIDSDTRGRMPTVGWLLAEYEEIIRREPAEPWTTNPFTGGYDPEKGLWNDEHGNSLPEPGSPEDTRPPERRGKPYILGWPLTPEEYAPYLREIRANLKRIQAKHDALDAAKTKPARTRDAVARDSRPPPATTIEPVEKWCATCEEPSVLAGGVKVRCYCARMNYKREPRRKPERRS